MGESGCGKTTLLRVLLGFVGLRSGALRLDGELVDARPELLTRLFALVPQEPFLLRGSILENVRLGNKEADDAALERACELAGVTAFAAGLPQGLSTQVGRDGSELSVGQRQRVCLARALASGAPILLLDEVQAPLDPKTEKEINDQLLEIGAHRAILAVTHRPTTAAIMDEVLVLREGRIHSADDLLSDDAHSPGY
jgi:ATP-binding cassette subfamily B protein